jgi:hypothetical protein
MYSFQFFQDIELDLMFTSSTVAEHLTNNPKNQQFESCHWSWERENGERERKKIEPNCAWMLC